MSETTLGLGSMKPQQHDVAIGMLTVACLFWALSFPLTKALSDLYQKTMPDESTYFVTGIEGALRFLAAGLLMLGLSTGIIISMTRSEFFQGLRLGLFCGIGLVLQIDGLNYTAASTSAFLTQTYCVILPLYHAQRQLRSPGKRTIIATLLVLAGVAILAQFDFRTFTVGRGELETLISTLFFTVQILELEQPKTARNRTANVSVVMFLTIGILFLIIAFITNRRLEHFSTSIQSGPALILLGLLILFCTLGAFNLMNGWQRFLTSTEAGVIYATEPLFASVFALILPGWISGWSGLAYANETPSTRLIVGGGLIVAANLGFRFSAKS